MNLDQICSPHLAEFLLSKFGPLEVVEKKATCNDCFCSKPTRGDLPYYDKNLKCCTFHPYLPNYAVGGLFEDSGKSEFSKFSLIRKIEQREYTLPMGIFVPVAYQVKFNQRQDTDFGNRHDFLCPYYNQQTSNCGIWRHRGAVCTSYYCISDRGESGLQFWQALGDYLHCCEMVLAQDCVVSMGLPPEAIDNQLEYINCETGTEEELASNSMSEVLFNTHWQGWDGSIEQFYRSCNRYIRDLDLGQLSNLLDEETFEHEQDLRNQIRISFS
jgi:hypothetical protein